MIERLCGIVRSGLVIGNSVVIVATKAHREQLLISLADAGVDVPSHARESRFVMCDAEEMLDSFLVNGMPDRQLFDLTVKPLLQDAKRSAKGKDKQLTVFGEMVAVMWEQGLKAGALKLEAIARYGKVATGEKYLINPARVG